MLKCRNSCSEIFGPIFYEEEKKKSAYAHAHEEKVRQW